MGTPHSIPVEVPVATNNSTSKAEAWFNSVKTVATLNISGAAGTLFTFSIVLLLIVIVYKKLSDFIHLVNGRLHSVAGLIGVDGFHYHNAVKNSDLESGN